MHDPHDDLLEQELSRLSEYTGEPAETPLWEQAVETHRREQQQRLWVWVRRPAPALAAAGLALLVATIALRPVGSPTALPMDALKAKVAERDGESRTLAAAARGEDSRSSEKYSGNDMPLELTQNSPGMENYNVRSFDRANDLTAGNLISSSSPEPLVGGAAGSGTGLKDRVEIAAGPGVAGGVSDPRKAYGGGVNTGSGRTTEPPVPSAVTADAVAVPEVASGKPGNEGGFGYSDLDLDANPVPTSNLALAVPDLKQFYYKVIPSLFNEKLGEGVEVQRPGGAEKKEWAESVNLTLRVNENRLPEVLDQLKRSARVQVQNDVVVAKEVRLARIDAQVETEKRLALKLAELDSAAAPAAAAPADAGGKGAAKPADTAKREYARQKSEDTISALNRRRSQIEQGGELATINIVAVPEARLAAAAAPAGPPTPATPLATTAAAPVTTGPDPLSKQPTARAEPVPDSTPPDKSDATKRFGVDGKSVDLADTKTGLAVEPPPPAPVAPAAPSPAPSMKAPGAPASRTSEPAEGSKISKAASEGLDSLGDSTANVVRGGIASMIYWLPALVAVIGGAWWWRRRAAAAVNEPPPE